MTTRAEQLKNFLDTHLSGYEMQPLAGDASFRRYVRVVHPESSYMLMDAPPEHEDIRPFMAICQHLRDAHFNAPGMIAHDAELGFLLLEDLGDDTFSRLLRADPAREEEFYRAAVELLAEWHKGKLPATLELPKYDHELLMREIGLFSNWFLPQFLDGKKLEEAQQSYVALWDELLKNAPLATDQFVHRDYHADNLMWLPARTAHQRVGLLDFQDAVMGDAAYDLVSLLEDARRDVPKILARKLIAHYVALARPNRHFHFAYALLAAQRNSKIIGIFTRLAARDGKKHYLDMLPRVWDHLAHDAEHPELVVLKNWLDKYVPKDKRGRIAITKDAGMLGLAA